MFLSPCPQRGVLPGFEPRFRSLEFDELIAVHILLLYLSTEQYRVRSLSLTINLFLTTIFHHLVMFLKRDKGDFLNPHEERGMSIVRYERSPATVLLLQRVDRRTYAGEPSRLPLILICQDDE